MSEEDGDAGWWMRLRVLVHNLTHRHVTLAKDDVAKIRLCQRRLFGATNAAITFPPESGLDPILVDDLNELKATFIFGGETPLDLRRRAILAGGEGVKR